jgi:hypothetical protein
LARGRIAYRTISNSEYQYWKPGSRTVGDELHCREGKSPDRQLRSRNGAKWKRKWGYRDSQEVGLEAAILRRVRNSSLVE